MLGKHEDHIYTTWSDGITYVWEKIEGTITDENRLGIVDKLHACYYANKLKLIDMFKSDKEFDVHIETCISYLPINIPFIDFQNRRYKFCVGEVVDVSRYFDISSPNYSDHVGIGYSLTRERAQNWITPSIDRKFTGHFISYSEKTGVAIFEENFVNGKRNGPFIEREENTGNVIREGVYENDKIIGENPGIDLIVEGSFVNGVRQGHFIERNKCNGKIVFEADYLDDVVIKIYN